VRKIDCNFLSQYNNDPKEVRVDINKNKNTIIMAEWYRRALAIRAPTNRDNKTDTVLLIVKKAKIWGWRSLRAASHHPDPVVRLGTRLGVLGAWLGLLGVWLGLLGVCAMSSMALLAGFGFFGILGVTGVWATWGPPRPRLN
jgi:hypothetical protein